MQHILFLGAGIVLLWFGAGWFIKGSRAFADGMGVSPLIIGLTLGAVGTSMPELLVSTMAAVLGSPGISIGNVVGSNMANIGLALAFGAVVFPVPVDRDVLKYDYPMALSAGILLVVTTLGGNFSRIEGGIFIIVFILYFSSLSVRYRRGDDRGEIPREKRPVPYGLAIAVSGLVGLLAGSRIVVSSASEMARIWNLSETIIGISVVAVGTSLPELAVVAAGSFKKQHEISIGTILGSNIINILLILGIAGLINPIDIDRSELLIQGPAVLLMTLILFPMLAGDRRLSRIEGAVLLALYALYMYIIF